MQVPIDGDVAAGFEPVRDTFASLWDDIEVGASCCAYVHGRKVVDLWGGFQDREMTEPWLADTLVNVYSTTKGLASAAVAVAVDEGLLDYDEKVSHYWPEFAAAGKQNVTVAQLLSHQAGLCGVETHLEVSDLYDWDRMTTLLAAQRPLWEPGSSVGYHAVTWGYFPGELISRVTGKTLGQYFREKIAEPLDAECHIGLPAHLLDRCADLIGPNRARKAPPPVDATEPPEFYAIALLNPSIAPYRDASSSTWRQAEIAAANGQANARGIATVYGALANEGRLNDTHVVSNEALSRAIHQEVGDQTDLVTGRPMPRARGFMLNIDDSYGPSSGAFGHGGAGGSTGFADSANGVGFGYAMNQMQADITATPRSKQLIDSVYQCLDAL